MRIFGKDSHDPNSACLLDEAADGLHIPERKVAVLASTGEAVPSGS